MSGSDHVAIRDSVFTSIGVALGDGDDVTFRYEFDGETRDSSLAALARTRLRTWVATILTLKIIRQFEVPADVNTAPLPRRVGLRSLLQYALSVANQAVPI